MTCDNSQPGELFSTVGRSTFISLTFKASLRICSLDGMYGLRYLVQNETLPNLVLKVKLVSDVSVGPFSESTLRGRRGAFSSDLSPLG